MPEWQAIAELPKVVDFHVLLIALGPAVSARL
jgi:hypothetical protein